MSHTRPTVPDVSVVVAVGNAEEYVGRAVRHLAEHLRSLQRNFEIVAVNDGSFDTSFAVLQLLARALPELRLLPRDVRGRAFIRGAGEARGNTLVLMEATQAQGPLGALGFVLSRLGGEREAVVVRGRWIAARRLPALGAIARARGRGVFFERSFEREALGLSLEVIGSPRRNTGGLLAPVLRFLAA